MGTCIGKTPDYFLLGIDYGDDSKDGKILQSVDASKIAVIRT